MAYFYLYSCNRYVYRYLSGRMIACLQALPSETYVPAMAHIEPNFLCITSRPLNRESRLASGTLDANTQDFPLTLRFNILPKTAESIPVYLVKKMRKQVKCEFTTLNKYDVKSPNHICAFVVGELPFSLVDGFLFDTSDDLVSFERPTPDLWYPEDLYGTIDHARFSEDLPVSIDEIQRALSAAKADSLEIAVALDTVRMRERVRAALYGTILKTNWKSNRYHFNMDSVLQEYFGLSDAELETAIPHYSTMKSELYQETIPLLQFGRRDNTSEVRPLNEELYALLLEQFSMVSAYETKGDSFWESVLDAVVNREDLPDHLLICEACDRMKASLRNDPNCDSPDILASRLLKTDHSVLLAFLFVARNANNLKQLSDDLKEYRTDPVTARRAYLLWFFLNAMYDVPGKGAQKENAALWQHIECSVSALFRSDMLYTMPPEKKRVTVKNDRKLLGITLNRLLIVKRSNLMKFFQDSLLYQPAEVIPYCASLLPRENRSRAGMKKLYVARKGIPVHAVLSAEDVYTLYVPLTPENIQLMIESNIEGWIKAYRSYWEDHDSRG